MFCITKPILKPIMSMTNGCSISLPGAIFTTKTSLNSSISIPSKPIKTQKISCSYSIPHSYFSFSLFNEKAHFPSLVAFVAEDNTVVLEEQEGEFSWDNRESDGAVEAQVSDWEGEYEVEEEEVGDAGGSAGDEGDYSEPPEDAKLFVGNLPYDVDSEKLAHLFEEAGVVEIAEVIYNRETDQSRGFGFVTMRTVVEAEKAVDMFNRYRCLI